MSSLHYFSLLLSKLSATAHISAAIARIKTATACTHPFWACCDAPEERRSLFARKGFQPRVSFPRRLLFYFFLILRVTSTSPVFFLFFVGCAAEVSGTWRSSQHSGWNSRHRGSRRPHRGWKREHAPFRICSDCLWIKVKPFWFKVFCKKRTREVMRVVI